MLASAGSIRSGLFGANDPGGRYVAITLDMTVQSAEQVRAIYAEIHEIKGLTHLF